MVIGFDGSRAFIPERTGTENYTYHLLKTLSRIDKKNSYIIYTKARYQLPTNFLIKKIALPRFWTQGGLALQTFKDDLDILFVPAHTLPLIRRPGLKTVVTVHDLGSEYLPKMHQFKQRLYLSLMQKFQLKGATKIIAVSKATKADLVKKIGIDPEKITVVYEGFDNKRFKQVNHAKENKNYLLVNSLKQYRLKPKRYFLFVGTVQPRKNLGRLIIAFSRFINLKEVINDERLKIKDLKSLIINHKSIKLVIAGSKGWISDEIYQLPKKLGIKDRVKFLGYVPDKDLPALYSGAIALTFPSLFEGFGLPILEAQACGCPVITSNISSMPEVAGKEALLVDPYNVGDIVEAMERLQITNYRLQLIKRGFENVMRFSWEKCAKETLKVLDSV
ncbi:glycosyltransferase family 4 protein [Candidatus Daviesbacteria bacterium]|nr:glycosyltransferase family 4 protein [Candidatus Daviesbacteria bacterium]